MRTRDLIKKADAALDAADDVIESEALASFGRAMGNEIGAGLLWVLRIDRQTSDECRNATGFAAASERVQEIATQLQAACDRQGLTSIELKDWFGLAASLRGYLVDYEAMQLVSANGEVWLARSVLKRLGAVLEDTRDGRDDMLTVAEVAKRLRVKVTAVESLIRTGQLHAIDVGSGTARRRLRISPAAIERFVLGATHDPSPVRRSKPRKSESKPHRWIQ